MPQTSKPRRQRKAHAPGARAGKGGAYTGERPPLSDWRVRPLPEPLDEDELVRLHDQGFKVPAIAKTMGHSESRVRDYLHAHGYRRVVRQKRRAAKHGLLLYRIWRDNRRRCSNPKRKDYATYGGRGIRFGWHEDFDGFYDWALRTGFKPGLCLDRVDRERDFEPSNCRWVSKHEIYTRLPRRALVILTAFEERKSLAEWSRDPRCGVPKATLSYRYYRGWPAAELITLGPKARPSHFLKAPPPPPKHPRNHIDWDEAVRLITKGRATTRELAERYGASANGISNGLRQRGVRLGPVHTHSNDPRLMHLVKVWSTMRCVSAKRRSRHYVGPDQHGVLVCRAWNSFDAFKVWARSSGYRRGLYLVRKNERKLYSPQNCAWVPPAQVKRKLRNPNAPPPARRLLTAFGETKSLTAWERDPRASVTITGMSFRLARGWTTEDAISAPRRGGGNFEYRLAPVSAFGTSKTPSEWLRDPRCRILSVGGLRKRLKRGWDPEAAISTPAFHEPKTRRSIRAPRSARGNRSGR